MKIYNVRNLLWIYVLKYYFFLLILNVFLSTVCVDQKYNWLSPKEVLLSSSVVLLYFCLFYREHFH